MPRVLVRPFLFDDLGAAAVLLAERHRRDRQRLPQLNKAFDEPEECAGLLRRTLQRPDSFGVAAVEGDRLVGFLLSEKQLHAPTSLTAQFVPPYTLSLPVHGHAVAPGVDFTDTYRLMYAEVAQHAVSRGYFSHRLGIIPGDRETEEAWVNLGFGRVLVCAARDAVPFEPGAATRDVEVHQASSEDLDVVLELEDTNMRHHFGAPVFWPYLRETQPAAREYQQYLLSNPANAHFIAYKDGQPLGMTTFNPPDWVNPLVHGGQAIYLFQGVVAEAARGNGVGEALLARSMRWANEQGYERCILHFGSANGSGARFWLKHDFVPIEYTMSRHIDERIAWARP